MNFGFILFLDHCSSLSHLHFRTPHLLFNLSLPKDERTLPKICLFSQLNVMYFAITRPYFLFSLIHSVSKVTTQAEKNYKLSRRYNKDCVLKQATWIVNKRKFFVCFVSLKQYLLNTLSDLTFTNSIFCPQSVFMCFVSFSELTYITSLNRTTQ